MIDRAFALKRKEGEGERGVETGGGGTLREVRDMKKTCAKLQRRHFATDVCVCVCLLCVRVVVETGGGGDLSGA